jgi:hypothetical protein
VRKEKEEMNTSLGKQLVTVSAGICTWLLLVSTPTALADDNGHRAKKGPSATLEDTIGWWQWALGLPSSVHPLTLKGESDPTGKNYCMVGQHGGVWYLGGIFKIIDPIPNVLESASSEESEEIEPFIVERECRIPLGHEILIPVLNVECNTAEEIALENLDPDATLAEKIIYLRDECAKPIADEITEAEAYFGHEGKELKAVRVERIATKRPFQVTFSPDNILNPLGDIDFANPDPNPSLTQADGYWAKVKPKKPGKYVLKTFGVLPAFDFALDITYELEVVVEGPDAIF